MLFLFACARHAPAATEPPCDPDALARDLQVALGPQECAADAECSALQLAELLPADAEQVPDMREWDPPTRPRIVTGPETSERAVRRSVAVLLERCPRTWNGRSFSSAVTTLPYSTPG